MRPNNEDASLCRPDLGLLAIADGVGGHQAGEIASNMACSVLEASVSFALLHEDTSLEQCQVAMNMAFRTAGSRIVEKAESAPKYNGMGTTMVAFLLPPEGSYAIVAHVGDSRLYLARDKNLERVTRDHTLYEELIAQGKAHKLGARLGETKNILTRALGIKRKYEVEVRSLPIEPGDRLLLCTDGLTDVVTDPEIAEFLTNKNSTGQEVIETLINLALERGGPDNVTIGVATVLG